MRFTNLALGIFGVGALVTAGAACGSSSGGSGGSSAGTTGTTSSGGPSCEPTAACVVADKTCLGLVDNTNKTTFGLRMSELDITAPTALATGLVKNVVEGEVTADNMACNLDGSGSFSWLLQFDTTAGTLKTGGAQAGGTGATGYSFEEGMITVGTTPFNVQPVVFSGVTPSSTGAFSVATGQDLYVPIFLNASGSEVVLLPLKAARLTMATLSASQNCIGTYNAANLDPANSCQPMGTTPQFNDGASLDGYMTLEAADTVVITSLNASLCYVLAGQTATYGTMNSAGITVCKRDANNNILFQGNWCDATNMAATSTCADSVSLAANFAASSVTINN